MYTFGLVEPLSLNLLCFLSNNNNKKKFTCSLSLGKKLADSSSTEENFPLFYLFIGKVYL